MPAKPAGNATVDGPPLLFERRDRDRWLPAPHARGPWDGVHGGVAGALMCAVAEEEMSAEYRASAATIHLMRPVPMAELATVRRLVHRGRRSALCDVYIGDPEAPIARASVTFTTAVETPLVPVRETCAPDLDGLISWPNYLSPHGAPWHDEAMEKAIEPEGVPWYRSRWRITGTESTFCRTLPLADWSSGISRPDDWRSPAVRGLPNVEYTLHTDRHPDGDWTRLNSHARWSQQGTAFASTALADAAGEFGRFSTTIILVP